MPGQITSTYQLPPHRMTKALSKARVSSRNVEGVNAHALNTNSREDTKLDILCCYFHRNVDHSSISACELQQFWQAACDLGHSYRGLTWHWTLQPRWWYRDHQVSLWTVKWIHGNIQFVHTIIICVVSVLCTLPTHFSVVLCLQELKVLQTLAVCEISTSFCSLLFESYINN